MWDDYNAVTIIIKIEITIMLEMEEKKNYEKKSKVK